MKIGSTLTLIAASFLAVSQAQAQHYGTVWDGGSGTWNTTNTNWDGTNVYFNSNDRTTIAAPIFSNGGGTVTVDESGGTLYNGLMLFENPGNWTFNGDPINSISTDYQAIVIQTEPGAGNVTINNTINIVPNPTNGGSVIQNQNAGTTIKLGNINISNIPMAAPYNPNPATSQNPLLFATNGSTIEIDGNITTDAGLSAGMLIGNYGDASMATGTYIFKGGLDYTRNSNKEFDFGSGNIVLETSDTGTGDFCFVGAGANLPQTILTSGAQTITNHMYDQGASNAIIGGKTADISTYSGEISAGGGNGELDLQAASGGRVYFSGNIDGDNGYTSKDGAGTVVLSRAAGNTFSSYNATIAFEAKAGTTLITNTSGSAFGSSAKIVQVDAGATLGGSGISTQAVTVVAGGIIAPGDAGQANLSIGPTISTLHLTGGLSMAGGSTLAFKIAADGASNDMLDLGAGALTLAGTTDVNFAALGAVNTDQGSVRNWYVLATGTGTWTTNPTFDITAPAGYVVDHVNYDPTGASHVFEVDFLVVPEPSTYALMIGGLAFLAYAVRRKNRMV